MKIPMSFLLSHLSTVLLLAAGVPLHGASFDKPSQAQQSAYLHSLAALHPIDAHAHIWKSDPAFTAMLERWNLHIVDILYVDDKQSAALPLDRQRAAALAFVRSAHGHASLCTTFDPFRFSQPDFLKTALDGLNSDFANGAIAVKIWKNVGMELKDSNGHYVMVDDPRLEPIYRDIEAHNKTLIAHQAEPDVAWGPLDPKALDASYYATHPEWNMEKISDAPAKQTILGTRDHLLATHPGLRVVGAHLGSMEADVDMVAKRLDRYPNFAIDTGARVAHLTIQPSSKVRAFLIKYQDRVLYGTDIEYSGAETASTAVEEWEKQLVLDWSYFATANLFDYNGRTVQGLHLPPDVLKKIYHANAVHWMPGVDSSQR
jgi:predicted TIM-barrel fold metal-dependent hydrolase